MRRRNNQWLTIYLLHVAQFTRGGCYKLQFCCASTKQILSSACSLVLESYVCHFKAYHVGAKTKISESLQMSCVTDIACMFKNSRIWHHALYRTPETPGGSMSLEWIYGSNCTETDDYIKATRSFWGRPRVGVGGLLAFSSWSHWNQ